MPEREILNKKPDRLGYKTTEIKYKHYGRNIKLLIDKAIELTDPEEKDGATIHIGRLMKSFQNTWNRDNVDDDTIVTNIRHYDNLRKTEQALGKVLQGIDSGITGDFLAADIRLGLHHLGEITGQITTDDLLDSIFMNFCIGK